MGENILSLDIEALKARLRSSPWVADATVGRTLPDTLKVEIRERVPLALAEVERLYLMDKDGGLIDLYGPRTAAFDLPIVRGLMGVDDEARRDRAQRAGDAARRPRRPRGRGLGGLRAALGRPAGGAARRGRGAARSASRPYRQRVLTFLSLRKDLVERCPDAEYFDLRFRGQHLREAAAAPASGSGAAPAPSAPRPVRPGTRAASPVARDPSRVAAAAPLAGDRPASTSMPRPTAAGRPRKVGPRVAKKKDRYIFGLDIGTHKICAIVAEITDEGRLDVIGIGQAESKGLRKGVVINLEATVDAIKRVLEEAELMAGVEIGSAYVGIAGTHIKGFNSRGVIAVSSKNRMIDREDVRRVIEAAKAVSIPMDREILHVLPQEFVVDDQDGIGDPTGMTGTRLEVNVHIITCSTTAAQNTVTCVNRAGLEVTDTVLTQIAAAEACLTPDEKELGVALVDIGGGTTDLAIFEKGSLWHTAVLQVGGEHFTNDVAVALRTPVNEAEKIKKKHGCALTSMIPEEDSIEVPSVGGRKPRIMARQVLGDVVQARAEEICQMVA